jgi:hypothetical protein
MTALITALAWLLASVALVLVAVFLLRMVKPLSSAIALIAERRSTIAFSHPLLKLIENRIGAVLNAESDDG